MKIFLLLLPLLGFSQLHHQTIGVGGGSSNNGVVFSRTKNTLTALFSHCKSLVTSKRPCLPKQRNLLLKIAPNSMQEDGGDTWVIKQQGNIVDFRLHPKHWKSPTKS